MHFDFLVPNTEPEGEMAYLGGIARRLQERGFTVAFLTLTRTAPERCLSVSPHVFPAYADFDATRTVPPDEIARLERDYRLGSIDDHVGVEVHYEWAEQDRQALYRRAAHSFELLEKFLAEHTVTYFLNAIGGEIIRRSMARVSERGGPTNLIIDQTPFPGRIVITTTEIGWDELPACPPPPSTAERVVVQGFLDTFKKTRKPIATPSLLGLGWHHWRRAGERLLTKPPIGVSLSRVTMERGRKLARRLLSRSFYERIPGGEPFFFFPLHQPNDASLTLRAPHLLRQEVLVEYIAERLLPYGTKLYVKPHIGARDYHSLGSLLRIARLPNVRLVEPTINPHDLIEKSQASLVINSTVGFEALCHQRPTVVFGRPFYKGFGVTEDVENLMDASNAIRDALAFKPQPEKLFGFLAACFRITSPGVCADSSSENVERTAAAILAKIDRLGSTKRVA